jgi:hypothetical protein
MLVAAVVLVPLAACTTGNRPTAPPASSTAQPAQPATVPPGASPVGAAPLGTSPPSGTAVPSHPPTLDGDLPSTQLPQPDPSDQACTAAALLAHVRAEPSGPPSGFKEVKIYNCAHGYARIYAAPNLLPGQAVDGDQFFLKRTGNGWKTIARGLATDCGDHRPELTDACASFG